MAYTVGMESYTIKQAAELLGLSKAGVRQRIQKLDLGGSLIKDPGPQGKIMIPDSVLLLLDTEHVLTGNREKHTQTEKTTEQSPCYQQSLTGNGTQEITGNSVRYPDTEYTLLCRQLSDLLTTVSGMSQTINAMQDTISKLTTMLEEKDKQLEEAARTKEKTQEQTDTKAVPTDPEGTQEHVSWWKRWFT